MSEVSATVSLESDRNDATQLRRRWEVAAPSAAVVLVHGIGEHSGRYEHVGAFLASRGYDTLGFDLPGFGQSAGRRAFVESFDDYLDEVEDRLDDQRRHGTPVVLLGHSLGGLIAATYLVRGRAQPDLAVLSAPALDADVARWQRVMAPVLGRVVPKLFVPSQIDGALLSRDVAVQQAYVDDPLVISGSTARLAAEIFGTMKTTSAALDQISVPAYVLHGDSDELVPPRASEGFRGLPDVTRRLWPGLRHESFNEPEHLDVLGEMEAWLAAQLTR